MTSRNTWESCIYAFFPAHSQRSDNRLCRKSRQTELFHTLLTEFFHSIQLGKGDWIRDYFPLGLIRLNETTGTPSLGGTIAFLPVFCLARYGSSDREPRSDAGPYYGEIQSGGDLLCTRCIQEQLLGIRSESQRPKGPDKEEGALQIRPITKSSSFCHQTQIILSHPSKQESLIPDPIQFPEPPLDQYSNILHSQGSIPNVRPESGSQALGGKKI
ncbi:hypothetical protein BDV32DRAFT_60403 [Aspergillus pseudonomiae]|nr:hypothetical protein BDV32DRAFT_60403 [Aspergillus pseudonomiae]